MMDMIFFRIRLAWTMLTLSPAALLRKLNQCAREGLSNRSQRLLGKQSWESLRLARLCVLKGRIDARIYAALARCDHERASQLALRGSRVTFAIIDEASPLQRKFQQSLPGPVYMNPDGKLSAFKSKAAFN